MSKNWKPTNEQIDCLQHLIGLVEDEWGDVDGAAYELLDDLKKLKDEKPKDGLFVPIVDMLPEDREYASAAGFEPKTIDELLAHEREHIKNTPLSEEPYFKAVAESLNNKKNE